MSLADEYRAILREAQDAANNVRGGIQDAYDRATGASGSVGRSGNGRVLPNRRLAPNQQAPLNYPSADELSADPRVYSATMYGASHPVGPPRLPPAPTPSMALSPLLANPITRRTLEDMQAGRGVKGGQAKFSPPAPASYDLPPELSPSPAPAPFFPNGAPPPPHINRYAPPANDPFGRGRPPSWLQGAELTPTLVRQTVQPGASANYSQDAYRNVPVAPFAPSGPQYRTPDGRTFRR